MSCGFFPGAPGAEVDPLRFLSFFFLSSGVAYVEGSSPLSRKVAPGS